MMMVRLKGVDVDRHRVMAAETVMWGLAVALVAVVLLYHVLSPGRRYRHHYHYHYHQLYHHYHQHLQIVYDLYYGVYGAMNEEVWCYWYEGTLV